MFGRAIVQSVNIDFELATIGLKEIGEWDVREGFEEVIQVTPVGFERLPCLLQSRLGDEEVAGDLVCGNARTPGPVNLVHSSSFVLYNCYDVTTMVAHVVKTEKSAKLRATFLLFGCYSFCLCPTAPL